MSLQIRSLAAAFVLVIFAAGAAQALPLSGPARPAEEGLGLLDAVWEWVVSVVRPSVVQSKSSLDPVSSEAGGMMDPNGSTVEAGSMVDPSTSADAGGMMDPNGLR